MVNDRLVCAWETPTGHISNHICHWLAYSLFLSSFCVCGVYLIADGTNISMFYRHDVCCSGGRVQNENGALATHRAQEFRASVEIYCWPDTDSLCK